MFWGIPCPKQRIGSVRSVLTTKTAPVAGASWGRPGCTWSAGTLTPTRKAHSSGKRRPWQAPAIPPPAVRSGTPSFVRLPLRQRHDLGLCTPPVAGEQVQEGLGFAVKLLHLARMNELVPEPGIFLPVKGVDRLIYQLSHPLDGLGFGMVADPHVEFEIMSNVERDQRVTHCRHVSWQPADASPTHHRPKMCR